MELTDDDLEEIREAARPIGFGYVKINISKNSSKLDLEINRHVRYEKEPTEHENPAPRMTGTGYRN
ncbi:MAG: hypothetical protein LBU82_06655 [Treponema sp.]|jgi:hypothetical protein|nr:hypothetical protein [Treponema sp.]